MVIAAQGTQFIYNIMEPPSAQPLNDYPLLDHANTAVAHASKAAEPLAVSQQSEEDRIQPSIHQ